MKLRIVVVGAFAIGALVTSLPTPASAQPEDCEAARCLIQATIDAECPCAEAKNHGRYTSCVARVVNAASRAGTIPRKCRNKINGCAIRSTCGKREGSVTCDFPGDGVSGRCRPLASTELCENRGGAVVASCCETCGGPEPTATPAEPVETATPAGPVATATPAEPVATETPGAPVETATPAEPVPTETPGPGATATESAAPTSTPEEPVATATPEEPVATATPEGPIATATEGPIATATPEEPVATATEGPIATATPEEPVATATEGPIATATEGPVATSTPEEPVATATPEEPVATATPTPEPTSTPLPGECVPGTSTCPNAGNGLEVCSMAGTCLCPSKVTFLGDPFDPASVLDTGWTGIAHRAPIISNGDVTLSLINCDFTTRTPEHGCGTCDVLGPIPNPDAGAGQLDTQRCSHDSSIKCTTDDTCGTGNTCEFYFGGPLPLAAGGVTTCVFNQFNGPITGTANVESGEAITQALLTSRVYTGIAIDNPCPRCIGDGPLNDGTAGGLCNGGTRNGLECDGNGTVANRPDFGTTSLDCPLDVSVLIATLPIDLTNATDPVVKTLTAGSPGCSGDAGERCLCDTCNHLAAAPCDSNADCVAVGATVCGGRRCIGGANAGAPCAVTAECSTGGGICGRPGEPTKASACLDNTATAGVLDCTDTGPVDGEGECTEGPITQSCSVASGHAQRGCTNDGECGGAVGSCESTNRACFLTGGFTGKVGTNTLVAIGMEDPPVNDVSHPTLAAVFCVGPTGSTSVNNVAGLPGPGRVTITGTALGLP